MARMPVVGDRPVTWRSSSAQNSSWIERRKAQIRRTARGAREHHGEREADARAEPDAEHREGDRPDDALDLNGQEIRAQEARPGAARNSAHGSSARHREIGEEEAEKRQEQEQAARRDVAEFWGGKAARRHPTLRTRARGRRREVARRRVERDPAFVQHDHAIGVARARAGCRAGRRPPSRAARRAGPAPPRPAPDRGRRPARPRPGSAARYRAPAPPRRAAAGRPTSSPAFTKILSDRSTSPSTRAISSMSRRAGQASVRRLCQVERRSSRPI